MFSAKYRRVVFDTELTETGTRLCVPKQTEYEFVYLFGAACYETGNAGGLVLLESNTAMMNLYLQEMEQTIDPGVHALLVLDQASWHHSKSLVIPTNIIPDQIKIMR